jgi:hypothetical protein
MSGIKSFNLIDYMRGKEIFSSGEKGGLALFQQALNLGRVCQRAGFKLS